MTAVVTKSVHTQVGTSRIRTLHTDLLSSSSCNTILELITYTKKKFLLIIKNHTTVKRFFKLCITDTQNVSRTNIQVHFTHRDVFTILFNQPLYLHCISSQHAFPWRSISEPTKLLLYCFHTIIPQQSSIFALHVI